MKVEGSSVQYSTFNLQLRDGLERPDQDAERTAPEADEAGDAERLVYRIVKTDPPTVADFLSNAARGRARRGPEARRPELHTGLSLYDGEAAARATAQRFPFLGAYLAAIRIPAAGPVRVEQTLGAGHCTIWGHPDDLLALVVAVVPV